MEFNTWLELFRNDINNSVATSGTTNVDSFIEQMYMDYLDSQFCITEYDEIETVVTYHL